MTKHEHARLLGSYNTEDSVQRIIVREDDPAWLQEATTTHEHCHHALTSATTHGLAERILTQLATPEDNDARVLLTASRQAFTGSAFLTHEGAASIAELVFIETEYGPDTARERAASLPINYRIAIDHYDWLLECLEGWPSHLAVMVVTALAQACLNTTILDEAEGEGFTPHFIEQFTSRDEGRPDRRLAALTHVDVAAKLALTDAVESTVALLSAHACSQLTPGVLCVGIDVSVADWTTRCGFFPVARPPVLDGDMGGRFLRLYRSAAASFGSPQHMNSQPAIQHGNPGPLESFEYYAFQSPNQELLGTQLETEEDLEDWVEFVREYPGKPKSQVAFSFGAMYAPPALADSDNLFILRSSAFCFDISQDVAVVEQRPFMELLALAEMRFGGPSDLPYGQLSLGPLVLPEWVFDVFTSEDREWMFSTSSRVFITTASMSDGILSDLISNYDLVEGRLYPARGQFPNLLEVDSASMPATVLLPVSSRSIRLLDHTTSQLRIEVDRTAPPGLPMDVVLAGWHLFSGLRSSE